MPLKVQKHLAQLGYGIGTGIVIVLGGAQGILESQIRRFPAVIRKAILDKPPQHRGGTDPALARHERRALNRPLCQKLRHDRYARLPLKDLEKKIFLFAESQVFVEAGHGFRELFAENHCIDMDKIIEHKIVVVLEIMTEYDAL